MRVEPYTVGSYVHVMKRGARGMAITGDEADRWRFVRALYYMNDEYVDPNWLKMRARDLFYRPDHWPERKPLMQLFCFTLMPNHLHLILKETHDGGIARFMQKMGQSMTNSFNEKYAQTGSIFQGAYKARTMQSDRQLRYTAAYIMVKNVFELFPRGGLLGAQKHFDDAWKWALAYPFSSLGVYAGANGFQGIDNAALTDVFTGIGDLKRFSRDVILGGKWSDVDLE